MKGAIMQPYFFPYIGYYQLAYEVEKFVFLDDVTFIKQGYINRNSILLNGKRHEFSIPVSKISSYRKINDHQYLNEQSKFLKMIEQAYKKAPFYTEAMPIIQSVISDQDNNVSRKNIKSITKIFDYLEIERCFLSSSCIDGENILKGPDRVLSLCAKLEVDKYTNSIGGKSLYSHEIFNAAGINLKFIQSNIQPYPQGKHKFTSHLSMIDVLMHCDKQAIINMLGAYDLVD